MSGEPWEVLSEHQRRAVRRGVKEPVEQVACPTCGAQPGRACAVGFGKRLAKLPHPKRRADARALAAMDEQPRTDAAVKALRDAADELDDIAAHLDPRRRSVGVARGYRLAAHHNRSVAAVLEERTDAAVGR